MSLGAGFSAAGTSPAGTGDVDFATVPSGNLFVDANGVRQACRLIDPASRQYVLNSDGSSSGMASAAQLVQLRIQTLRDSSALPGFGKRNTGGKVNERTARQVKTDVEECLSDLVVGGVIRLVEVTIERAGASRIFGLVKWVDLSSGIEMGTEI